MVGSKKVAAVGLAGALAGAALVTPAAGSGSSSPKDRVVGLGQNNPPLGEIAAFMLDARSGPNGESPWGIGGFGMAVSDPAVKFTYNAGIVQCLRVSGNQATLVYRIKWTRWLPGSSSQVDATRVWVQDNGTPANPHEPVDKVVNALFNSQAKPHLLDCPDPASQETAHRFAAVGPLTKGDIWVVDN